MHPCQSWRRAKAKAKHALSQFRVPSLTIIAAVVVVCKDAVDGVLLSVAPPLLPAAVRVGKTSSLGSSVGVVV
jgi:hypothetical protein